ncbi:mobile element protein [Geomicrobium sp. JCM 19039]|nr:mobile element protein [Geomicrobium sp. JCM 19039]
MSEGVQNKNHHQPPRYSVPERGSKAWRSIYTLRTAVERVIAYLKEFFQLNNNRSAR